MPKSDHRSLSIRGLVAVSVLNIIGLAFIVYHFATEHHQAGGAEIRSVLASSMEMVGVPMRPNLDKEDSWRKSAETSSVGVESGNVGLAPAAGMTINIASYIPNIEMVTVEQPTSLLTQSDQRGSLADVMNGDLSGKGEHWVQLGALSNVSTARQFWGKLRNKHGSLLQSWTPRYVSPSDEGGRLHHLRVGPMQASAAEELCDALKAGGADCFCMSN